MGAELRAEETKKKKKLKTKWRKSKQDVGYGFRAYIRDGQGIAIEGHLDVKFSLSFRWKSTHHAGVLLDGLVVE